MSTATTQDAPTVELRKNHKTYGDFELDFNTMLGRIHDGLRPELGVVFYHYPNHCRFITDKGAKTLAEKWSLSFYERPDFKEAGLWVGFYIDTVKKCIKATVKELNPELIKVPTASTTSAVTTVPTVATVPTATFGITQPPLPRDPAPVRMPYPYYSGGPLMPQFQAHPMHQFQAHPMHQFQVPQMAYWIPPPHFPTNF
jgi:hypothetical protein